MPPHSHTSRTTHRTAYSAGGVIYRLTSQGIEVALIATDSGERWGLPKGHVQRGETAEAAAEREMAEETGLSGKVQQHLATIEYWFRAGPTRIHKYVDMFLLIYQSGELVPQISEVDDARWFPLEQALALASFDREREVLAQVWELWTQSKL